MQTPYGAQGICKHSEFLDKHEYEMSSPSRRLSNAKFRKGGQVEANLGALARNQLELNDKEGPWGSKSPFVHEEDHDRHVKPDRGGRMISSGDRLRLIKAKNNKIETAIEKLRNKLLGAQMRLEREEKRAHEKDQKEAEKRRNVAEKEADRARKAEEKAKKDEKQVGRQQALVAQGKKPRGRRPTISE